MIIEFGDPIEFAIPIADFPTGNFSIAPLARHARVKVFVLESAHKQMIGHVNSDREIECGGVLVGYPFKDRQTQQIFVVIVGVIRDITENRSVVHFTVTTETISRTRQIMENNFPGLIAVGWYHSHPGHGVFLSGQDMTIVRGIYNEPWNLAWVIDPIRSQEGIFYSEKGEPIIENKDSHPLFHDNKLWIPLQEIPECIKELPLGELDHDQQPIDSIVISDDSRPTNRDIKFSPRREELLNRRRTPWILSVFFAAFALTIVVTVLSLFYSSWSLYGLLINDIVAIFGLYILMSNHKQKVLNGAEFRRTVIMLISVICFLILGIVTAYLDSRKISNLILPIPVESSAVPAMATETPLPTTVFPVSPSSTPATLMLSTETPTITQIP